MAQNSIYVAPNSSGNGTSWQNPSNIQDAISNASTNDTIKLKEGVYMISTTLNIEDQLNILGGYSGIGNARDPHTYNSILDGGNQVSMVHMTIQSNESTIDGVYFEKGFGTIYAGGLTIYGSRVKVLNCVFRNNVSESTIGSAAVNIRADEVLIENSLFENNQVIRKDRPEGNMGGAAIHIRHHDNTRIVDCEFINNTSYYSGGAISSWGPNTSIENCLFAGNHTQEDGGAIYINFDDLSVTNCVFTNNTASENGGALFNNNGQLKVSKSVLKDNSASSYGGGLYGKFNEISLSKVSFENNQASLQGGAIYCSSSTIAITDAIFWNNKASTGGGAIYNGEIITLSNIDFIGNNNSAFLIGPFTTNTLYNSIFYNNTSLESLPGAAPDIALQEFANPNSLSLEIVQNILQESPIHGIYHDNLIGIDPYFIDESTGDFNLQHASPAIDAGKVLLYNSVSDVNAGISEDLAGNNRLTANNIDIGAYEYSSILNCTKLSSPLNNSADVAIDTDIQWEAIAEATGYRISIGTTSGGTDIADNLDVGDVTSYSHPSDFPEDTTIYVSITPYNEAGDATACSEEQFTTEKLLEAPSCTQFISPIDGESDVALNAVLQWEIITDASGYRISLGTTSGGTDIADNLDVGNVTSYSHPSDFPEDTTIYMSITPYNEAGDATTCSEEQFTTEKLLEAPPCTWLISPIDGESDVALNAVLQWDTVTEATGYRISIGTISGGTDIADNLDVGNVTSYSHPIHFPEDTTIYVSITPYNEAGDATTCSEEQFTTEKLLEAPSCTQFISPIDGESDVALNAVLQWEIITFCNGMLLQKPLV
ncbi:fibronectin, type III, partial [Galbibacter marinus]